MADIVEQVACEIADIPGNPSSLEIARIAIEAYQRALWTPHFDRSNRIWPEIRRSRASQITAFIMNIVGKHLCDHGDVQGHREASSDLFEALYESGAEVITDADRAAVGLSPRGPYGLTEEQLRILDARYTEAMLRPIPTLFDLRTPAN
jgi:cytosine/adenosine deaminase-related metal-dependent hydrolase